MEFKNFESYKTRAINYVTLFNDIRSRVDSEECALLILKLVSNDVRTEKASGVSAGGEKEGE